MSEGKRLYVGNLAFDCAWYDLKDHFKSCGNVVRADIMEEHGGRSKGCGIVEFALAEEAQLAIATLNDTDLKGRPIFVREDRETSVTASGRGSAQTRRSAQSLASELKGRPFGREDREASSSTSGLPGGSGRGGDSRRLYVGNLAFDCAWYDLKDLFKVRLSPSPPLFSSHLISSHLIPSHLISSHLISSHPLHLSPSHRRAATWSGPTF